METLGFRGAKRGDDPLVVPELATRRTAILANAAIFASLLGGVALIALARWPRRGVSAFGGASD